MDAPQVDPQVTIEHCERALEMYAESLLSLSDVQGVGLGETETSSAGARCCVMVYLVAGSGTNLPSYLEIPLDDGRVVRVPVRSEVQGTLCPERLLGKS